MGNFTVELEIVRLFERMAGGNFYGLHLRPGYSRVVQLGLVVEVGDHGPLYLVGIYSYLYRYWGLQRWDLGTDFQAMGFRGVRSFYIYLSLPDSLADGIHKGKSWLTSMDHGDASVKWQVELGRGFSDPRSEEQIAEYERRGR